MSFITDLKKLARSVAKDGLERVGIKTYDIPEDDDEIYPERDIIDIYLDKYNKKEETRPQVAPIPESLKDELRKDLYPLCGFNQNIRQTIDMWLDHREEVISFNSNNAEPEISRLKAESLDILIQSGIVQTAGDNALEALQRVARAQNRPVINLLRMASYQITADTLETWIESMNQKLDPFNLTIIQLSNERLSLRPPRRRE